MQPSIFRSIILGKTPCLFAKEITQSERRNLFLSRKNSNVGRSSYTRDLTEGEETGLSEGTVAQVSSKHNEYQVSFI